MVAVDIYCDAFPVLSETFVAAEARALRALGHDVRIVAGARPDTAAVLGGVAEPLGSGAAAHADGPLPVRYVSDDSASTRGRALARVIARHPLGALRDRLHRRRWSREEPARRLRELAPAIVALRPGVHLHAHFAAGAALDALRIARITGRRFSVTAHAYDIYLLPRNLPEKLAAAAFATSGCEYTVRDLRAMAPDADVHEIVMGIDPAAFTRRTPYAAHGPVVAVGRLTEKKGFLPLVRAAAIAGIETVIVGEGPQRAELEAEIARLGAPVTLVGAQQPDAIRTVLEGARALAMPCVVAADGDRDSMPVVVKEAMAMELPVVVSDEVGLPELVTPECGVLVPPGDAQALAAALGAIDQRMGAAGRARVQAVADVHTETARLSALIQAASR